VDDDPDQVASTHHRFIDGVVDNLVGEMVQAARRRVADIHAGALTDRLQPAQHLDHGLVVDAGDGGFLFGWGLFRGQIRSPSVAVRRPPQRGGQPDINAESQNSLSQKHAFDASKNQPDGDATCDYKALSMNSLWARRVTGHI